MEGARRREGAAAALGAVLAGLVLANPCAFALNPALDASQYAHNTWKIRDGFFKGVIDAIAQTSDGYLWLGTEFGLVRFDGVHFASWEPPRGEELPTANIRGLLAARDGTLWIGTADSFLSWKGGKLTRYSELAGESVWALAEDSEGTVWAAGQAAAPAGKLCAIRDGSVRCYGEDGRFGRYIDALYADRARNLWVGGDQGLWRWQPDPPDLFRMPGRVQALMEDAKGTLAIAMLGELRQLVGGKADTYPLPDGGPKFSARALLRDRDGGLWIGTTDRGIVHAHGSRTDVLDRSDGLTGDFVERIFEDREGTIWVATLDGLDRFHDLAVPTMSTKQGLSNATVESVLAAKDGSVWLGTLDGLDHWNNGRITVFRKAAGLPDDAIESMLQDSSGRVWVATRGGLAFLENNRFHAVAGVPSGVQSIAEDRTGDVWVSARENLFRLHGPEVADAIPWIRLERPEQSRAMVGDPSRGGLWLAFRGAVAYFKDGAIRETYKPSDGLAEGHIRDLQLDREGALWASALGGLSRLKDGRVATLTSKNGLPCDDAHWVMEDDDHFFWIYMACGLVRVERSELDAWAVGASHNPAQQVRVTVFGAADGVRGHTATTGFSPSVARSADGKLWFLPWDGVSVVDPRRIPSNRLPPPVFVEQITADGNPHAISAGTQVDLPPRVRDLEIDYTALSLAVPEKVLFRYKLEGWDRDWQEAANRRQAFYTNLGPHNYRFRVRACNDSGVWSEADAIVDIAIAPAYYQTWWFRLLCVAAFLALLVSLYRLRLRQVAQQFNIRLDERVSERTRIARDLHDTLLQSFQGVLMKFDVVSALIPSRPDEAQRTLEDVVAQARQAIVEGRDAVYGLRSSTTVTNDLVRAIGKFAEELATARTGEESPEFDMEVEGESRDLLPLVRDEVYRIACEALRNAFQHARAARIDVEVRYHPRRLRIRVRDNGRGIDPQVLDAGGSTGHYGLPGMRERAKLVGGKLTVRSRLGSGTEAELSVPASIAYGKSPAARRSRFAAK